MTKIADDQNKIKKDEVTLDGDKQKTEEISDQKLEKESQVKEKTDETVDLKNKYLRALADYQNLERQTQSWKDEFSQYATSGLLRKLLEVLDDLEKASDHLKDEGLTLIVLKFWSVLEAEGVKKIEVLGKEYNPHEAEVVSTEPGEKDNIVTNVLQKGYIFKDKIIRPAKVVVSTK